MRGSRSVSDERLAEAADVVAIYQIVLGRNPESDAAIETYRGASTTAVIAQILLSGEMSSVVENALANGTLTHPVHLTASDFGHASGWLSAEIDDFTLEASASWWLLIDRFVNELWRARLGRDVEAALADYASFVALRADEDRSTFARMQSSMAFDADWFRRAHARSIETFSSGTAISPARYFLSSGRLHGDQLLAAFGEDMRHIYRTVPDERRSSLSAHVEAIIEAAGRGETAHWLFDADFCREVRTREARRNGQVTSAAVSYLQFLLDGDRDAWAPHPLFSHRAYRTLNAVPDDRSPFEDYLIRGMFEGCRTSCLFDPDYYLELHPDARLALLRGSHHDALHHFLTVGIYQDFGFSPDFDIAYYREIYPDVVESVRTGAVPSACWHFLHRGLLEGRRPNRFFDPHYYAQRHPHVVAEMAHLGIVSALEHFLLVGRGRGLKAEPPLAERRSSPDDAKILFRRRALRSFDRQWRTPLDFRRFTSDTPVLSVIVPVSNEVPFTALFLECAYFAASHMAQAGRGGIEVIVVDNGSTDQTARLVERSNGVTSLQFPEPIGYPRAIAAGMSIATGEIVIVANNDVVFQPDAFGLAVSALGADTSIGVLGPLVMLPDETLQEAGSFVDRSGGIVNLGRYDNPWDAYFRAPIEADYCAGCFFAFRREDFERVGGIDEAFSPGYYEDVDLNFRMRDQLGKRAVVLPDLQVVHFEHASFGKGRPPSTAFAAIRRNQTRFAGKHGESLLARPTPSALAPRGYASAIAIGRKRMLVIVDTLPHPGGAKDGGRTIRILRGLDAAGLAFDLLVLRPDGDVDEFEDPRVTVRRGWMPGESAEVVLADADHRFSHVLLTGVDLLGRFAYLLEPLRQTVGLRIVCDTGGLQAPALLGDAASSQALLDAVRLELRTPMLVSPWIAGDERERALIEEAGLGAAISIAATPLPDATPGPDWADREGVLLLAGAGSCVSDVAWFADRVEPSCSPDADASPILVAGGWQTRLSLQTPDGSPEIALEIVDATDDAALRRVHGRCRVAVAPPSLRSLAAVLQAMAFDVPVILPRQLAKLLHEGASLPAGLAIAGGEDGASSYSGWLDRLTADFDAWSSVQHAQRALLADRRQNEDFAADIGRLLEML